MKTKPLSTLAGVLFCCLAIGGAWAQASPVPASTAVTFADATTGQILTQPPAAPQTVTVTLTVTPTGVPLPAVAPQGSDRLQTPGTNADGSTGSKTSVVNLPARTTAVNPPDIANVTDTLTLPMVTNRAGQSVPVITNAVLPSGWQQLSPTVFVATIPVLPGVGPVKMSFQGTMAAY